MRHGKCRMIKGDDGVLAKFCCALLAVFLAFPVMPGSNAACAQGESDEAFRPGRIIVSMGDSYSSGEGIAPFYGQKNVLGIDRPLKDRVQDEDWLAHRSEGSWPGQLTLPGVDGPIRQYRLKRDQISDLKDDESGWFFVASSGAMTQHFSASQEKPYRKVSMNDYENLLRTIEALLDPEYDLEYEDFGLEDPWSTEEGTATLQPQLDILDALKARGAHVDYVTLTIGGNDLEFSTIVSQVFTSNDVDELNRILEEKLLLIKPDGQILNLLETVYREIADRVDPDTAILVAGYPRLFAMPEDRGAAEGIGLYISAKPDIQSVFDNIFITGEEAAAVNDAVMEFNRAIEDLVTGLRSEEGINIYFVDVAEAFRTHEAYSADPYISPVIVVNMPQDRESLLSLQPDEMGSDYSVHPNEAGAAAYAACVQKKIDELESLR